MGTINGAGKGGFFGKLPSHGDFVSRRLPTDFIHAWDDWLQAGLTRSREHLGRQWLPTYLYSPIWRFAVAQGVCSGQGWAGVMLPSVDKVGRYFPLTLAFASRRTPAAHWHEDGDWYAALEALAWSALTDSGSFDRFDIALRAVPAPTSRSGRDWPMELAGECWLAADTARPPNARALFWTTGSAEAAPAALSCPRLPSMAAFCAMLQGGA